MGDTLSRPIPVDNGDSELVRYLRDEPPAHFILKIDSFSSLSYKMEHAKLQRYESDVFEAGGYKWKLALYPNGDKENNGEGHLSLYLEIVDTKHLPLGWEVSAIVKFFVYNQIKNKYLTIQGANGTVQPFREKKIEVGCPKLLPLSTFKDGANGYLVLDKCVLGAEVFVTNGDMGRTVESLTTLRGSYTWKIDNFSSLDKECYPSDVFTIGNKKWKLWLYPKGNSSVKNNTLSLFLAADELKFFPEQRIIANYELCIVNQYQSDMEKKSNGCCFSSTSYCWGFPSFLSLNDLRDSSKGFLVNDTLIVQAHVSVISTMKTSTEETGAEAPKAVKVPQEMPQGKVQHEGLTEIALKTISGTIHDEPDESKQFLGAKVIDKELQQVILKNFTGTIDAGASKPMRLTQTKVQKGLTDITVRNFSGKIRLGAPTSSIHLPEATVHNEGLAELTVKDFSGTFRTGAAKATKLQRSTMKNKSENSDDEDFKVFQSRKPWLKRCLWF